MRRRGGSAAAELPDWCLDFYSWQVDQPPGEMIDQYLRWVRLAADYTNEHTPQLQWHEITAERERRRAAA